MSNRENESGPEQPAATAAEVGQPPRDAAERRERTSPPNHVFIGKKPVMSYAMSTLIQLVQSGEVVLKARGMVISRAVDVAEIVTKKLGNNVYEIKKIAIDTERLGIGEEARNVSTIEIIVAKK